MELLRGCRAGQAGQLDSRARRTVAELLDAAAVYATAGE